MKFKIGSILLCGWIQTAFSADVWSGWVYDKASNAPVAGALITSAAGTSATTDAKGHFEIDKFVAGVRAGRTLSEGWNPASQTITANLATSEQVEIDVRDLDGRLVARPQNGLLPAGRWIWSPLSQVGRSGFLFVRLVRNGKTQTWSVMNSMNRGGAKSAELVVRMAGREAGGVGDSLAVSAAGYLPAKFWADPAKSVLDTFWLQSAVGVKFAIRWSVNPAISARVTVSGDTTVNYGETRKLELSYDRVLWKLDSLRLNGSFLSPRDTFTFVGINENKTLDFWLSQNYRLPSNGFYRFVGHAISTSQPNLVNVLFQVLDSAGYGVTSLDTGNFATPLVDGKVGSSESWFRIKRSGDIKYNYRFALLLDNSSSLNPVDLEKLKAAASKVVDNMFAGQQIAVWKVSGTGPTLVKDYTSDKSALKAGIAAILPSEVTGTPLYQSVITGVGSLGSYYSQDSVSQGSVLLFTDGRNEGGSSTLAQAVAARGQIPVYGILLANDPVNNATNRRSLDSLQNMGGSISVDNADLLESAMLDIQARNLRYTKSFYSLIYATSEVGNNNVHKVYIGLKSNSNHGTDSALTNSFSSSGLLPKIAPVVSQLAPTWGTGTSLKVGDTLRVGYTFQNVNGMFENSIVSGAYTVSDSSRITWFSGAHAIGVGKRYSVQKTDLDSQIHVEILPLAGRVYNFNGTLVSRDTGALVKAWLPFLVSAPKDTVVQDSSFEATWVFGPNGVCQSFSVDDSALPCLTSASYRRTFRFTKDTAVHTLKAIDKWGNVIAHSFTAILGIVKPVVFSPAGGVYTSYQLVTLASPTVGDSIYYTTNGTVPTKASTLYTTPISVTSNLTLRALALKSGWKNSDTTRATYTINVVEKPKFLLASGTYTSNQTLTLVNFTAGATVFYTTDGTTPDTNSTKYTAPIAISSSQTIKVIAVKTGWASSSVDSGKYVIQIAAKPVFSLASGTYTSVQTLALSTTTDSAKIFYTTDGTVPTSASTLYTAPISVTASQTLKAIALRSGWGNSAIVTETYMLNIVAKPRFNVTWTDYFSQTIRFSTSTDSAKIYYTTDGSDPTIASVLYAGPIVATSPQRLKAIAIRSGWGNSSIANDSFVLPKIFVDDRDSKAYKFVQIGSQVWMTQNLNHRGYGADSGWAYANLSSNALIYGRLYSWATALGIPDSCNYKSCVNQVHSNQQGICPSGWHIPSDLEWDTLIATVGVSAGTKLKTDAHWIGYPTDIYTLSHTDIYTFGALPGGGRLTYGFESLGRSGYWLSASDVPMNQTVCWSRVMESASDSVSRSGFSKSFGGSVRCLRNAF